MKHRGSPIRRAALVAVAALAATSAAGAPVSAQEGGQVEIFSYWTAGGEADGLNAIQEVFSAAHPDVEIVRRGRVDQGSERPLEQVGAVEGRDEDVESHSLRGGERRAHPCHPTCNGSSGTRCRAVLACGLHQGAQDA